MENKHVKESSKLASSFRKRKPDINNIRFNERLIGSYEVSPMGNDIHNTPIGRPS